MKQVAFRIADIDIHWYGVLLAIGILLGLWTAGRRALRYGIAAETIHDVGLWIVAGGILGARALYVISYWKEDFAGRSIWQIFNLRGGGLVFYGGLIGGSVLGIGYVLYRKLPIWRIADAFAPSVALGHVFGRLGCLMHGCCYGRPAHVPWAICFPSDHSTRGTPVHPTQLYEASLNALLFGALAWAYRHKKFDGQIFAIYLISYALLRSLVESFRGDYPVYYLGGVVTPAQLVSLGILGAGLLLLWRAPRPQSGRITS